MSAASVRNLGRILVAAGLALLLGGAGFLLVRYRVYSVAGPSMQPALRPGDRIVAGPGTARAGDVVILDASAWPGARGADRVKRVLATAGSTVTCCDPSGAVTVDGRRGPASPDTRPFTVTVPPGRVFLVGDNGPLSVDSRAFADDPHQGTVATSAVAGRVVAVAAPRSRASFLIDAGPLRTALGVPAGGVILLVVGAGARALTARRLRTETGRNHA